MLYRQALNLSDLRFMTRDLWAQVFQLHMYWQELAVCVVCV